MRQRQDERVRSRCRFERRAVSAGSVAPGARACLTRTEAAEAVDAGRPKTRKRGFATALLLSLFAVSGLQAQGAGSTGATVLQLLAGGRATGFSGAYAGARTDADVLFYNPAGIAGLSAAAAVSYQQHVADIGVATGSGAYRVGRLVLGGSVIFLDYGDITEYVPDPDFGNQTGRPTGNTVSASEVAARLSGALPLMDGRLNLGASAGWVSVDLAGTGRGTPFLDIGAQYAMRAVTLGAALRNLGGSLSGGSVADAELPAEARVGAMVEVTRPSGLGAVLSADLVSQLRARETGLVTGIEAGLIPMGGSRVGAVGRVGFNTATGDGGQGALLLGGGISIGPVSVDYAWQNYDLFGTLHRVGVRWARF